MIEPRLVDEIIQGFVDSDALLAKITSQEGPSQGHEIKQLWTMFEIKQVQVVETILNILKQSIPVRRQINRTYLSKFPEEDLQNYFAAGMLLVAQRILASEGDLLFLSDLSPLAMTLLLLLMDIKLILLQWGHNLPDFMTMELFLTMDLFQEVLFKFEYKVLSVLYYEKDIIQLEEQQIVAVLFCEAVARALRNGYLTQEMLDNLDPSLMLAIPRLGIVCGILFYPDSPLSLRFPNTLPSIFMPYRVVFHEIQYLLSALTWEEIVILERMLVMNDCEELESLIARTSASLKTHHLYLSSKQRLSGPKRVAHSYLWPLCSTSGGKSGIPAMLPAHSNDRQNRLQKLFLNISELVANIQSDSATEFSDILKMAFRMVASTAEEELPSLGQDRSIRICPGCKALLLLFHLKTYCQICYKAYCVECVSYRIQRDQDSQMEVCRFCFFSYFNSGGLYVPLGGPRGPL